MAGEQQGGAAGSLTPARAAAAMGERWRPAMGERGGGHGREPRRPLASRLLAGAPPMAARVAAERGPGTGAAAASGGELPGAGGMLGSNGRRWAPRHVAASRTAATALALARGNPARNDAVRLTECRCSKKNRYIRELYPLQSVLQTPLRRALHVPSYTVSKAINNAGYKRVLSLFQIISRLTFLTSSLTTHLI